MSITVVGSVALDTVETASGKNVEGLGGAATYFSLAAAHYAPVHLVGVVGEDFPPEHIALLESKGIDLSGLERKSGKTFRWSGRYHDDMNVRDTLDTQLNVFEQFHPELPAAARNAKFLFLGNIHPGLQADVLKQASAEFVALDTMNLWIDTALDELKAVLKRVHAVLINDSEVYDLTGHRNLVQGAAAVQALGPPIVVVKKGEHGAMLFEGHQIAAVPALPLKEVVDSTGAGDTFAGGFMGYLTQQNDLSFATLRRALAHGSVVASYTCEAFGPDRLAQLDERSLQSRYKELQALVAL